MGSRMRAFRAASAVAIVAIVGVGQQPASAYPRPGRTELVSISSDGSQAQYLPTSGSTYCLAPAFAQSDVTPDGRYVVFSSPAYNLVNRGPVPGDTNAACDVFVRDRITGKTELVSVASDGSQGVGGDSGAPSMSATGRYVAFASYATNLVLGDTNVNPDIFVRDRKKGVTRRVSVSSDGAQAKGLFAFSAWPAISANGRFVAFSSLADNLVEDDTNNGQDVFVHDLKTGKTVRASVDSKGAQTQGGCLVGLPQPIGGGVNCFGGSITPSLSGTGRFVAFSSYESDLVSDDNNGAEDIFVHDLRTNKTVRVSVASDGTEAFCGPLCFSRTINQGGGQISATGRYVTFTSKASNLVPNDTNDPSTSSRNDSFVHDLKTGRTERVSVTSYGGQLTNGGLWNAISASGRYVGFTACTPQPDAQPLPEVGCASSDVYVHDRVTGALVWASSAANGKGSEGGPCGGLFGAEDSSSYGTAVSDRGYIPLWSCNPDLVPGDSNEAVDFFVRDLGPALGVGGFVGSGPGDARDNARVCIQDTCIPTSGAVMFGDERGDVDPGAAARGTDLIGGRISNRPLLGDLYAVLELESMPRTPALAALTAGTVYGMSFKRDGTAYEIRAASTGLGPRGETTAAFGLFTCSGGGLLCTKVTDLKGGFGTTGARIVFSLPLDDLGLRGGSKISDVTAFTAVGTLLGGPGEVLDRAKLK